MQDQTQASSGTEQLLKQNEPMQTVAEGLSSAQPTLSKPIIMAEQLEQTVKTATGEITILHQLNLSIMARAGCHYWALRLGQINLAGVASRTGPSHARPHFPVWTGIA